MLILSGTATWLDYFVETYGSGKATLPEAVWSSVGGDPNAGPSWEESMWMSWGLFFDPGTQTGWGEPSPASDRRVL